MPSDLVTQILISETTTTTVNILTKKSKIHMLRKFVVIAKGGSWETEFRFYSNGEEIRRTTQNKRMAESVGWTLINWTPEGYDALAANRKSNISEPYEPE